MKGFLFVENNCTDAAFWLTAQGSISLKFHKKLIGCVVTDKKNNPKLLMSMLLETDPKKIKWTAEDLNSMG